MTGIELNERLQFIPANDRSEIVRRLIGALAGTIFGVMALIPISSFAEEIMGVSGPHSSDGIPKTNGSKPLQIGFRETLRSFADEAAACGDGCFSLSPVRTVDYDHLQSAYDGRELSLNLGQSGPVSLRFTGRRLKMQFEF